MTPEQRARTIRFYRGGEEIMVDRLVFGEIAAAIRSAVRDALEKAAEVVDAHTEREYPVNWREVAKRIRALKDKP